MVRLLFVLVLVFILVLFVFRLVLLLFVRPSNSAHQLAQSTQAEQMIDGVPGWAQGIS